MNQNNLIEYAPLEGFYYIPDFIGYVINKDGEVFSLKTNKFLTIDKSNNKYNKVEFCINGKCYCKSLHRIIAKIFVPRPEHLKNVPYEELQVNHIDLNKRNNSIDNLEWMTPKENTKHSINNGMNIATPVLARDIHTNEIKRFEIAEDCLNAFFIPKTKFWQHMKSKYIGTLTKSFHVFKFDDNTPWPVLKKNELVENSLMYEQRGRWLAINKDKKTYLANTLYELCDLLNIGFGVIAGTIKRQGRKEEGNIIDEWLIQYFNKTTPEEAALLPPKKIKNNNPRPIKLTNVETKEELVFLNYDETSNYLQIKKARLARILFLDKGMFKQYKLELI